MTMADDKQDTAKLRREYSRRSLDEDDVAASPIQQFALWFRQALAADITDANAMTLATASAAGAPSARIVLLKGFDEDGFRFFTNYESRKGQELDENPAAALCFYWPPLERQVRIEGSVEKLSRDDSAAYFESRPRLSQIGAWASSQSRAVASRAELQENFELQQQQYQDREVPLPDFWGGYLVRPQRIEFWQGRPGRLHDRLVYTPGEEAGSWSIQRLSP